MKLAKYRQLLVGFVVGIVVAGGGAVFADSSVSAVLSNSINFTFNGQQKQLPDGYSVLSYQDHTYVPARFVAEALGAKVDWNGDTNTVIVTSGNSNQSGLPSNSSSQKVGHYTFDNYSLDNSSSYSTDVIGEITNGDSAKHDVLFRVNFYDANGKLLGYATGAVQGIGPGEKKSFDAMSSNVVSGINTYSFQIDLEN